MKFQQRCNPLKTESLSEEQTYTD